MSCCDRVVYLPTACNISKYLAVSYIIFQHFTNATVINQFPEKRVCILHSQLLLSYFIYVFRCQNVIMLVFILTVVTAEDGRVLHDYLWLQQEINPRTLF